MFNNILKMKLKEIKKKETVKRELSHASLDIPMKVIFENTPSAHLTVYRGNIRQLETVWTV